MHPLRVRNKKILLVHAGFGQGHKKAALSLEAYLNCPCFDLLDFCPPIIKRIYSQGYIIVTEKFAFLWKIIFSFSRNNFIAFMLGTIHRILFFRFYDYLRREKFDAVVTTHFFSLQILSTVKEELNLKLITIITDLGVHPLWIRSNVDIYFAAIEETKAQLLTLGVCPGKIIVGAVPLREGFLRNIPLPELRRKFSLDDRPGVVFVSSVSGHFRLSDYLLDALEKEFNIFVIYGKNKTLAKRLRRRPAVRMFSFWEEMWELFSLSSVVIGKPGGMTVFEGIYKRKPFIFTHYIPGQEKENMDLLIKYGVARFAANEGQLLSAIRYFAAESESLARNYPLKVRDIRFDLEGLI